MADKMLAFGNFGDECYAIWMFHGRYCINIYPVTMKEVTLDEINAIEFDHDCSVDIYSEMFDTEYECYEFLLYRD